MLITPYYKAFMSHFYIKILMLSVLKLFIFLWLYVCVYNLHVWVGMHTCRAHVLGYACGRVGGQRTMLWSCLSLSTVTWVPEVKLNSSSLHNEHLCSQSHHPTSPFYCLFLIQRLCFLSWLIFCFFSLTENTVLDRHAMWIFTFS